MSKIHMLIKFPKSNLSFNDNDTSKLKLELQMNDNGIQHS